MRASLGYGFLTIGTVAAALGLAMVIGGIATKSAHLFVLTRRFIAVVLFAAVGAFVVMETALFGHDFSIQYVADNVARATPGLYTFTAAWSALEGSILLWALLLAGRSYREMSELLGVGEGALRVRVLRCRRRAITLAAEVTESTPGRRAGRREEP